MTRIAVLMISLGLLFPATADARKVRKFRWSGETWSVRHTYGPSNPGRNIFSDSKKSVWVNSKKQLVLRIHKGRAVEIGGTTQGYGTFTWSVASPLNNFDLWRVVGLFVWFPNGSEHDLEFAHWGVATTPLGWSVEWYKQKRVDYDNFTVSPHAPYKVRLTLLPMSTRYVMTDARGTTLLDVTYQSLIPTLPPLNRGFQPRMSHWFWPGVAGTRMSRRYKRSSHPVLRLNSFSFTPVS